MSRYRLRRGVALCGFTIAMASAALLADDPTKEISWRASGRGGAVAAGGSGAVAAGIRLLEADGNAADAAVATLLALAVTDYGWFAIGGEIPFLIYDAKKGEVKSLSGLGRAPLDEKAIEWFYENGIPSNGSMKAAPTPGAIDLYVTALRRYGTKTFAEAVQPTLELLDAGNEDWHPNLAKTLRRLVEAEATTEGDRDAKLAAVSHRFYRGDIADELEAWYIETGAFLRKNDLAAHETLVEEPVHAEYRGYTVYKCGTWTQGPVLCQTLRLLEGFELREMGHLSVDAIHTMTESLKLAFADRDAYYGDPRFVDVPMRQLLSDDYTELRRALIDPTKASLARRPGDPRGLRALRTTSRESATEAKIPIQDTTTCVVADRWGNVVAATPSCNLVGNQPGPLGVTQGNRVRSLNTTPGHPNRVQAGKRPRITLTPTIVTKDGKPVIAISVAGGDLQDQTTLNVLLGRVDFGLSAAEAVTAPRFATAHHEGSFDPNPDRKAAFVAPGRLTVSDAVPDATRAALAARGHDVRTSSRPIAYPVMLIIDPATGVMHAAGDPAAKRHAAAIE